MLEYSSFICLIMWLATQVPAIVLRLMGSRSGWYATWSLTGEAVRSQRIRFRNNRVAHISLLVATIAIWMYYPDLLHVALIISCFGLVVPYVSRPADSRHVPATSILVTILLISFQISNNRQTVEDPAPDRGQRIDTVFVYSAEPGTFTRIAWDSLIAPARVRSLTDSIIAASSKSLSQIRNKTDETRAYHQLRNDLAGTCWSMLAQFSNNADRALVDKFADKERLVQFLPLLNADDTLLVAIMYRIAAYAQASLGDGEVAKRYLKVSNIAPQAYHASIEILSPWVSVTDKPTESADDNTLYSKSEAKAALIRDIEAEIKANPDDAVLEAVLEATLAALLYQGVEEEGPFRGTSVEQPMDRHLRRFDNLVRLLPEAKKEPLTKYVLGLTNISDGYTDIGVDILKRALSEHPNEFADSQEIVLRAIKILRN